MSSNSQSSSIGILGGSFDPIHNGHLNMARYAFEKLNLTELCFMPCGQHAFAKPLQASKVDRLAMLELAIKNEVGFTIDPWELDQAHTSYTIDTLKHLREELGTHVSIVWLLGMDAFLSLPKWKDWQNLLNYCHLVVMPRDKSSLAISGELKAYLDIHQTNNSNTLQQYSNGKIYFLNMPPITISSTLIRSALLIGELTKDTLPKPVLDYILQHKLYNVESF